jgi:hypothetical protein
MNNNLKATTIPGGVIIVGACSGLIGFALAIPVFYAGLGLGLVNTMLPRIKGNSTEPNSLKQNKSISS